MSEVVDLVRRRRRKLKRERVEISSGSLVFRFYFTDPDNFDAILLMDIDGDEGVVKYLKGDKGLNFFKKIRKHHKKLFPKGINYIRFGMMAHTLRALKAATKDVYDFKTERIYRIKGRGFYKVQITLKDKAI